MLVCQQLHHQAFLSELKSLHLAGWKEQIEQATELYKQVLFECYRQRDFDDPQDSMPSSIEAPAPTEIDFRLEEDWLDELEKFAGLGKESIC